MEQPKIKTLRDWRARRAGGRITVYGENVEGREQDRITNVDELVPEVGYTVARDKDGVHHRLLPRS